ncbi:putative receptor like protein 25 [Panicum virgatum]|uniref:putative receptor like protein 25 n=1 Tax=Panicum virgatum TaxID=38727 RepID=UPI0019D55DF0|nr:putative receptor like protein 25 [Panicum virgatum]
MGGGGQERLYTGEIVFMVNMDLSCNNLTGNIPEEIGTLIALTSLNLSSNAFSGEIPETIGALVQVESLDLSHNELSGEIPTSLSALRSLSHLNLSYNNLTGKIPSGNQLQVLDDLATVYIGNPGLCGDPLSKKCPEDGLPDDTLKDHQHRSDDVFLFVAIGSGFVMGIMAVFYVFLFKTNWRVLCFAFYDGLYDEIYVQVCRPSPEPSSRPVVSPSDQLSSRVHAEGALAATARRSLAGRSQARCPALAFLPASHA